MAKKEVVVLVPTGKQLNVNGNYFVDNLPKNMDLKKYLNEPRYRDQITAIIVGIQARHRKDRDKEHKEFVEISDLEAQVREDNEIGSLTDSLPLTEVLWLKGSSLFKSDFHSVFKHVIERGNTGSLRR